MYSGQVRTGILYDRKIRYLDYFENDERLKGIGFIKLERRDELCNLTLQINGLYRKDRFTRPLYLITPNAEVELCKIEFADGKRMLYLEALESGNLCGQGIHYEEVCGIYIPISEGKEIRCVWRHIEQQGSIESINDEYTEAGNIEMPMASKGPEIETDQEPKKDREYKTETSGRMKMCQLKEDKWEQLWAIYPHVHPFADEREYLSLGPNDFVLLQHKSYHLVSNSFLLHGYYQYRHLILMRNGSKNGVRYYIGVPGNLHEREKQTAIFYGFEGFEGTTDPAREGDFGYYLVPVEL